MTMTHRRHHVDFPTSSASLPPTAPRDQHAVRSKACDALRRGSDVVIASIVLLALSPLLALVAIAIRMTSRGRVLFRQTRLGLHGNDFVMLKYRTMYQDAEDEPHRRYVTALLRCETVGGTSTSLKKLVNDVRVTRVGSLLRRTSIDEIPQLVNVLRGDMTLVGPRPALGYEVLWYQPHHHRRFEAKPGLTGLWQVSGRSLLGLYEALELDVEYVERRSLAMDLNILARTPSAVLRTSRAR